MIKQTRQSQSNRMTPLTTVSIDTPYLYSLTLFFIMLALLASGQSLAASLPLGAASGERLHFNVSWLGLPAGDAKMEMDVHNNRYTVKTTLGTTGVVKMVHELDDTMKAEGKLNVFRFQAQRYIKNQRKNDRIKITTYTFDHEMLQVVRDQHVVGKRNHSIHNIPLDTAQALDPISSIYALRAWPKLLPNSVLNWSLVDGKKIYCLTMSVGGSYRLRTELGKLNAFPVTIVVENSEKMKKHHGDGDKNGTIVMWLTDDRRRMPVRIESQMPFGSLVAELASYQDGRGERRGR